MTGRTRELLELTALLCSRLADTKHPAEKRSTLSENGGDLHSQSPLVHMTAIQI